MSNRSHLQAEVSSSQGSQGALLQPQRQAPSPLAHIRSWASMDVSMGSPPPGPSQQPRPSPSPAACCAWLRAAEASPATRGCVVRVRDGGRRGVEERGCGRLGGRVLRGPQGLHRQPPLHHRQRAACRALRAG